MGECRAVLGIDEAGRGPLVGPMVVAGIALPEELLYRLPEMGVRDSKQLTPASRRRLAGEILRRAIVAVIVKVPPRLIDSVNLNRLEEDTFAYIAARARELLEARGCRLRAVYADAVGQGARLRRILEEAAPGARVVAEPRADARHPPVAAASIVAKVERDAELERLRRLYGVRGSGYPTDPETLEWIREAYQRNPREPPPFIRGSWATLRRIAPGWYRPKGRAGRSLLDYIG
ncbi:MAG: ribonuclease HII [Crenarchaeota archaeon]|nr:ribonuclease HII [Thermoproteota archaeon]